MMRRVSSPSYNYAFSPETGFFVRWGDTVEDDPSMSPLGPEIADIEITTQCAGPDSLHPCPFCYKGNTKKGKNMSLDEFKRIVDLFPPNLTQIAFGADATCTSNPDIWAMMDYCRSKNIVPNITVANVDTVTAWALSRRCGAVAVSRYSNQDFCYDSVQRLTSMGMKQVNIHQLLSEETFEQANQTLDDARGDSRLLDLNAIVFLSLKQKGRGKHYTRLEFPKFKYLVNKAERLGVNIGFDSCSSQKFLSAMQGHRKYTRFLRMVEPCESTCFSIYVNVEGKAFPCSFSETKDGGIDLLAIQDFMSEVWNSGQISSFRDNLLNLGRSCPLFEI